MGPAYINTRVDLTDKMSCLVKPPWQKCSTHCVIPNTPSRVLNSKVLELPDKSESHGEATASIFLHTDPGEVSTSHVQVLT